MSAYSKFFQFSYILGHFYNKKLEVQCTTSKGKFWLWPLCSDAIHPLPPLISSLSFSPLLSLLQTHTQLAPGPRIHQAPSCLRPLHCLSPLPGPPSPTLPDIWLALTTQVSAVIPRGLSSPVLSQVTPALSDLPQRRAQHSMTPFRHRL